jgi:small redox-active disulfide protein 2
MISRNEKIRIKYKEEYYMGLFKKSKKEEGSCCCGNVSGLILEDDQESDPKGGGCDCNGSCCDGNDAGSRSDAGEKGLVVKVLGSGCKNCITLADNLKKALEELHMVADIVKVTDFGEITRYGVMSTPALVVNEKVVSYGKVLKPQEIIQILNKLTGEGSL